MELKDLKETFLGVGTERLACLLVQYIRFDRDIILHSINSTTYAAKKNYH
jgi:hypothetical protein